MGEAVAIHYPGRKMSPAELAQRYRVMAALHPEGVTLTMSREELLSKAQAFEAADEVVAAARSVLASGPTLLMVEVEPPMAKWEQVTLTVILGFIGFSVTADAARHAARFVLGAP
ncbi:hypothetical protein [Nostoc phage Nsp-JY21]